MIKVVPAQKLINFIFLIILILVSPEKYNFIFFITNRPAINNSIEVSPETNMSKIDAARLLFMSSKLFA